MVGWRPMSVREHVSGFIIRSDPCLTGQERDTVVSPRPAFRLEDAKLVTSALASSSRFFNNGCTMEMWLHSKYKTAERDMETTGEVADRPAD